MIAAPSIWDWIRSGLSERPAVDGGIHPRHAELALVVDGDFDDGRDIAHEAAVDRNAEPVPFGHRSSPFPLVGDEFNDAAQTRGVDRVAVERLAIVPGILDRIRA